MTGLEPVPVAVDERGLDVAALDAHDVAAVLVAPAHSYPTGATLDTGRRRDLVAWARRHDALIIEDDYDAEFRYDRVPIGALQGLAPEHVVYLGSASKTVSPALRLGWVAAPPALADALEREKRLDDMGVRPARAARVRALRRPRRLRPLPAARPPALPRPPRRHDRGPRRADAGGPPPGRRRRAAPARDPARRRRRARAGASGPPTAACSSRTAARHWADPARRRRRWCSATARSASPRSAARSACWPARSKRAAPRPPRASSRP